MTPTGLLLLELFWSFVQLLQAYSYISQRIWMKLKLNKNTKTCTKMLLFIETTLQNTTPLFLRLEELLTFQSQWCFLSQWCKLSFSCLSILFTWSLILLWTHTKTIKELVSRSLMKSVWWSSCTTWLDGMVWLLIHKLALIWAILSSDLFFWPLLLTLVWLFIEPLKTGDTRKLLTILESLFLINSNWTQSKSVMQKRDKSSFKLEMGSSRKEWMRLVQLKNNQPMLLR